MSHQWCWGLCALSLALPLQAATSALSFNCADSLIGGDAITLAAGDFNNDGNLDLALANERGGSLSILLGNGDGTFAPGRVYATGPEPHGVVVGDFNGDKNLDLAVVNSSSLVDAVSILLGNGDGTFSLATPLETDFSSRQAAIGDVNLDGKLDLVVTNFGSGSGVVSVFLGNGDGTFQPKSDFAAGSAPYGVTIADFNSDAKPDIAVVNISGSPASSISIFLGNGDGTFVTGNTYTVASGTPVTVSGDFNGDNKVDLLGLGGGFTVSGYVSVLLGSGDGSFGPASYFGTGPRPNSIVLADFNGDGNLDIATSNSDYINAISILSGNGDGTFQSSLNFTSGSIQPSSVAAGDFNGDGQIDFVATLYPGSLKVCLNTSRGSVPPIPGPPPPPLGTGPADSAVTPQASVNEPINTGNGNYYYQHTDFVTSGRGIPLVFQRSYNTLDNYSGPLGVNWTHSYNVILTGTSDGTINIRWGDGRGETFTPTQPGVFSTLVRNADDTFVLTRKNQTQYAFSSAGKLTTIRDRNGNTVSCTYDANGNLVQITDAGGRSLTLSYDANGHILQLTDPSSRRESFQYSAANDLISTTDPAGGITLFAYDANHHVTSIVLPTGNTLLQNTYDSAGRVASQKNGRNATTSLAYDVPNIGDRTITDARGNQTIHTYDGNLRIIKVKDALLGTTNFTYDANNDRTSVTNAAGEATSFAYDAHGNLTGINDPLGDAATFVYDARNSLLNATNAKGHATTFSYDGNSNLISIHDASGAQTTFNYDSFGELTSKTDARGNTTSFGYNNSGNLTSITDALGNPTALAYDSIGRLASITDPKGHTASAFYDALSRLVKIADPLGNQTRFAYDAVGNLTQITDANGHMTAYAYDAVNNLARVTDALGHLTQYAHDTNNNRIAFTNARGKTSSYAYDAVNRLASAADPLGFATAYAYDSVGNVTAITDAKGQTDQFAYDALNRLIGISYADGKAVSYAYDADSDRTSMADSHGTTAYSYDPLDRLTSVANPGGKTVVYGYDSTGNRVSLTYPDGKLTTYSYDGINRLSRATDWAARSTNYTYDQTSNLKQILYPTSARLNFNYDAANRLQQVVNSYQGSLGNPISSFTYLLDAVGNRLKVTDGSGKATSYAYDALNELKSVTVGTSITNFTYDAVGNRLTLTAPSTSINYSYDAADRLLAAGVTTFAYDKNGNQVTKTPPNSKPLTFTYDAANRLISVLGGKANSAFAYDGDGNRIGQSVGSGVYNYLNDVATALPVVLQESGPDGNISYAQGLGLISESGAGFDYFYHYDGLGSVVGLTDPGSKLAGRYSYDAWGQTDTSIPDPQLGTKNKFRYTGEALDPGTQLYFLRARFYDPSIGRFAVMDPSLGKPFKPLSLNRFVYVDNAPVSLTDPSGLTPSTASALVATLSTKGPMASGNKIAETIELLAFGPFGFVLINGSPEQKQATVENLIELFVGFFFECPTCEDFLPQALPNTMVKGTPI